MKIRLAALAVASVAFLSSLSFAQAPVVDRVVRDQNSGPDQTTAVRNNYLEIQALREEISSLRGLIEELGYEVRKVQQRQDDDYQDLDRRLASGAGTASISGSTDVSGSTTAPSTASIPATSVSDQPEVDQLYRDGFNALRGGDRQQAVALFEELVTKHPGSGREADSLYWLGETHWLNLESEKSRQSFSHLLEIYPEYRKSTDAQYRLGLIYDQLGDKDKAIEYMRPLAEGDSTQSQPARTYLEQQGAL